MVDVLSARLQDLYTKWESRSEPRLVQQANSQILSYGGLRRYGHQERLQKRALAREASRESKLGDLLEIKEEPWQLDLNMEKRPFMGLCCNNCTSNSRNSAVAKVHQEQGLRNILLVDAQDSGNNFLTRKFCHLSTVYQLKKYEYPQLALTVVKDEQLRQVIEAAAKDDYSKIGEEDDEVYKGILQGHEARATKILYDMRSTLSDFLLRVTSWLLYKLLPRFLTSVVAHPAQVQMLIKASNTGLPLIFLPMHRSHLDYILISFILLNNNIRSPLVAAGDNLRIPVFGWLLRGLGAFFIKRRMDPVQGRRDTVYRAVLHTYMMACLRAGHNIEFFIEGGRTRTGKACLPKGGLLSVIVDAYMDGTIEDALLVPVSVNYEKLVDGNFVREQLGQPKQMETFWKAIRSIWSVLNSNYGMMRIDFNQPFSLRELVRSFHACNKSKLHTSVPDSGGGGDSPLQSVPSENPKPIKSLHTVPSSASLYGTDIMVEEHRLIVESIARHIVYDCSSSTAVMSTNAVAFLLLNRFRNGVIMDKLVEAMEKLKKDLFYAGRDFGFTGDMVDVINHACDLLGPGLVRRERVIKSRDESVVMVRPFTMVPNVIELSYYSNVLLSHFVLDSVVVTALYSLLSADPNPPAMVGSYQVLPFTEEQVQQFALDLCEVLQFEFIFTQPCRQLETAIEDVLTQFRYKEILLCSEPTHSENHQWAMRFVKNFSGDSSDSGDEKGTDRRSTQTLMLDTREEALQSLEFYHALLRPLIDVYAVSALGLHRLVGRQLTEHDYLQELLLEMRTQLKMGFAQYEESLSVDPFKNSLKLFERWEVLECLSHDRIKLYYLRDEFDSERNVQTVFEKVKRFKWAPVPSGAS
ncbi:Glycerol-3-phosphate acyltransferase 1, mitochondrial [Cryptotermes secundus]|nr:glycerol-3-phosphate acyltransferase 1, mitochondrial isoform X2 [Cryptotermes secundus]XP_023704547.1 glycerol-3-phosphate acyltransferase 1, mitochondrial isoform X2 [Cryptotermes secundus]PNF43320.1 Glycerol-3-phosphate acyltransferase 1, mitochondrial [Cryptotermes secundus]